MWFRNYRSRKTWLATLEKSPIQNMPLQSTCETVPNTGEISMRAFLSAFFIILREVDFKIVSSSVR